MAEVHVDPADSINRDNSHGSKGGKAKRLKWLDIAMEDPSAASEGSSSSAMAAVHIYLADSINRDNSHGMPKEAMAAVHIYPADSINRDNSHGMPKEAMAPVHIDPVDSINRDNSHGMPKEAMVPVHIDPVDSINRDNSHGMPKEAMATVHIDPADSINHDNSHGSKGGKARRLKGSNIAMEGPWAAYKGPVSSGSKGGKAKRLKLKLLAVETYDGPSSLGMKAEEPNIGTSPLHKLHSHTEGPMSTFSKKKKKGQISTFFASAARRRSMFRIKPEFRRGKCLVCSLVDDHPTSVCPYKSFLPEDAIVSSVCVLLCNLCGESDGRCECYKVEGRTLVFKFCHLCCRSYHWSTECPCRVALSSPPVDSPHQTSSAELC